MKIYNHQPVYDMLFTRVPRPMYFKMRKDGEFFLATSAVKGEVISLNSLAGEICSLCDGEKSIADIYDKLIHNYPEVDKQQIAYDLCTCISDLDAYGLASVVWKN